MKAIICQEPGRFELVDRPEPIPGPGEALLRIHRVGICGTDLHAYAGNQAFFSYPRILGHELSAEIVSVPDNPQGLRAGDRVIVMPYVSCGECVACRVGKTNCCRNMQVLGVHIDGGMQEYITLSPSLLLPAGDLSHEETAVVEPLAIGAHALRRAGVVAGEYIVVVGCGPIGIGLMALARHAGCEVIALETNPDRLAFVRRHLRLEHALSADESTIERIAAITGGDLATAVFDATGHPRALENGVKYMAHGGRYVLVGLSKGNLVFNHPEIHARETTLLCSRNATLEDFLTVRDFLARDRFPTAAFITHTTGFPGMIGCFNNWTQPATGVIKAMVRWADETALIP